MLVLTRNDGQSFIIGNNIRVTILRAGGGAARVGIEAPRELTVLRSELVPPAVLLDLIRRQEDTERLTRGERIERNRAEARDLEQGG